MPVYRLKYIAVVISGALAGLGGVFLVFIAGIYREGQTNGRGFIGLAALIFGNWRPGGLAVGAGLFGYSDAAAAGAVGGRGAAPAAGAMLLSPSPICQFLRAQARAVRPLLAFAVAAAALVGLPDHRRAAPGIVSFTPHSDHAARAVAGVATTAHAEGRRPGLPTRRARVATVAPSTGTPCARRPARR